MDAGAIPAMTIGKTYVTGAVPASRENDLFLTLPVQPRRYVGNPSRPIFSEAPRRLESLPDW